MNAKWIALAQEAGMAAEHLALGVSLLGKANYAKPGHYYQAFFGLTVGLERAAKLAFILDYYFENNHAFPPNNQLKKIGHDLEEALQKADCIAKNRSTKKWGRLPQTDIHKGIIKTLSEFATDARYYNLNFITGDPKKGKTDDPLKVWYERVIAPVLRKHLSNDKRDKIDKRAKMLDSTFGNHSFVLFHAENGDELNSVYKSSLHSGLTEYAKPYCRLYLMQIIRFLAQLLSELGYEAYKHRTEDIPHMSDFFGIFLNEDAYLKNRKTWEIVWHPPFG